MTTARFKTTFFSSARKALAVAVASSVLLTACATDGLDRPLTSEEKVAGCAAMIIGGAILGAVIGNNTGNGNAGDGAAIGAVLGGGACAVWLAFEAEQDKVRIANMRQQAALTGQAQQDAWKNASGQDVAFRVTTSDQSNVRIQPQGQGAAPVERVCRTNNETATAGGRSETTSYLICRNDDGSWTPAVAARAPTN